MHLDHTLPRHQLHALLHGGRWPTDMARSMISETLTQHNAAQIARASWERLCHASASSAAPRTVATWLRCRPCRRISPEVRNRSEHKRAGSPGTCGRPEGPEILVCTPSLAPPTPGQSEWQGPCSQHAVWSLRKVIGVMRALQGQIDSRLGIKCPQWGPARVQLQTRTGRVRGNARLIACL